MKEIGLIGLGNIGGGMCRRLLDRGIGVVGFDLSPAATKAAAEHGARIEVSPAAVAQQVDVVVTSLSDPPSCVRPLGKQGWPRRGQEHADRDQHHRPEHHS